MNLMFILSGGCRSSSGALTAGGVPSARRIAYENNKSSDELEEKKRLVYELSHIVASLELKNKNPPHRPIRPLAFSYFYA